MNITISGRKDEQAELNDIFQSKQSELFAVYGYNQIFLAAD